MTDSPRWLANATHDSAWPELSVCVAGIGVSGAACARALRALGAKVTVVDARSGAAEVAVAEELRASGVAVRLADGETLPDDAQLVVTSPGWRREAPLLVAAAKADLPVWGEPELAWRLRCPGAPEWLVVTGTDGKTTTTLMLESILRAAGLRTTSAGNIGTALVDVANGPYDALAVELGSFQLHWSRSVAPPAAAVLNVAPDHLDWWGGSFADYAAAKGLAFAHAETTAVGNADDPQTVRLLARAPGRRVAFTLLSPRPGQLGVVEDLLIDRAFVADPDNQAVELATLSDIPVPGPHNVANALAAAALARAHGVSPDAVAAGLRDFRPAGHRIADVGEIGGVRYVDDSKATSPHAASASLTSFDSIVWIAGGLGKDIPFDDAVQAAAPRLRAVVLFGSCRSQIHESIARHAPEVPVVEVAEPETADVQRVLDAVVACAAELARPGDVVLLAPAAASMDMFRDYRHRGDEFAAAVRRLRAERTS
ncbi:MAG TPA: UDP-N-acetylmuramoyl-L-alanine--D-glutamate ligase [Acidothermaceae bacterium]|jgi:UDP-N-acetylmuramoylalanine--D-glutamate ligase